MRNIEEIIIHCSASDAPEHDNVESIDQWHKQRGWDMIGYHYVITKNGRVHEGRPLNRIGAHCKGRNYNTIGICLTGNVDFTESQFIKLVILIKKIRTSLQDKIPINPHSKYNQYKTCPNFDLNPIRNQLNK